MPPACEWRLKGAGAARKAVEINNLRRLPQGRFSLVIGAIFWAILHIGQKCTARLADESWSGGGSFFFFVSENASVSCLLSRLGCCYKCLLLNDLGVFICCGMVFAFCHCNHCCNDGILEFSS